MEFCDIVVSNPTVFCVEDMYCFAVPVNFNCFCSVKIGDNEYFDHANGVKRLDTEVHLIYVKKEILDSVGMYSVNLTVVYSKGPDDNLMTGGEYSKEFKFYPIKKGQKIKILHIADTHSCVREAIRSKDNLEREADLIILNGDLSNVSDFISTFRELYTISGEISRGERPCIFSRGNHDLRGKMAEKYDKLLPTRCGKTYFTTVLGDYCFIVLDCGEDKPDNHIEYSGAICCEQFRREETEYVMSLAENENVTGAKHVVVVCHIPFTRINTPPFDIEIDTYKKWTKELDRLGTEFYLFGHIHRFYVGDGESSNNHLGALGTIVVGSMLERHREYNEFSACEIDADDNGFLVREIKC